MIGIIYHVVEKDTNQVVKVGSTIRTLEIRFKQPDYHNKYKNHFLREVRTIESSQFDWYEPKNPVCPFLWHLVAIEHLEMIKMGTYRKDGFSNQISPLVQKFRGLEGVIGGSIGGLIGGRTTAEKYFTKEHQREAGRIGGRKQGPINGRKMLLSGKGIFARTKEQKAEDGRKS